MAVRVSGYGESDWVSVTSLLYKPEPLLQEKLSQYCHSIVGGRDLCYGFELMAQILKL